MKSLRKIPRQGRALALLDSVLTATTQVLSQRRFKKLSTIEVAERAGVSVGSLYQYFTSKEALMAFYIERQLKRHTELFEAKIAEWEHLPMREFSGKFIAFVGEYFFENAGHLRTLYIHVGQFERTDWLMGLRHEIIARLENVLRRHQTELKSANPNLSATVLVHACMGVLTAKLMDAKMPYEREELVGELVKLADDYLFTAAG